MKRIFKCVVAFIIICAISFSMYLSHHFMKIDASSKAVDSAVEFGFVGANHLDKNVNAVPLPYMPHTKIVDDSGNQQDSLNKNILNSDLRAVFDGASYSIAVIDLANDELIFDVNADESFISASVYKLFIGYSIIVSVEHGSLTWNSSLNGMTLRQCFEKMLVESDNECPVSWLTSISSNEIETQRMHQIGLSGTSFLEYPVVTTAFDAARLLSHLYHSEGMSSSSAQYMLDCLGRQIYRAGIPSGLSDVGYVQDKVGFLHGILNDAALVYTPKGDYVMVIFTNGASWLQIARASRAIYDWI